MSDLDRLKETYITVCQMKDELRELRKSFQDAFKQHERYQEIVEQMKELRDEKKMIEQEIYNEAPGDMTRIDELALEVKSNEELVWDLALNAYLNNETVEIEDHKGNPRVPRFKVVFTKN